jgi:hypothetical protein
MDLQHRGLLILKEVLRWASSSIKKQSLHYSQVAKLVDADVQIDVEFEFQHNYRFESCPDYKRGKFLFSLTLSIG